MKTTGIVVELAFQAVCKRLASFEMVDGRSVGVGRVGNDMISEGLQ